MVLQGSSLETPALRALLDPEGDIASLVPAERTIWGVINSGGTIEAPEVIRSTTPRNNIVKLGHPDDRPGDELAEVVALLAAAG